MTVKLESNEVTPSPAGTVALVVLVEVELPHAATMIAIAPANTIAVDDLSLRNCIALLNLLVVPVGNDEKGWATVGWSPGRQECSPLTLAPSRRLLWGRSHESARAKPQSAMAGSNTL